MMVFIKFIGGKAQLFLLFFFFPCLNSLQITTFYGSKGHCHIHVGADAKPAKLFALNDGGVWRYLFVSPRDGGIRMLADSEVDLALADKDEPVLGDTRCFKGQIPWLPAANPQHIWRNNSDNGKNQSESEELSRTLDVKQSRAQHNDHYMIWRLKSGGTGCVATLRHRDETQQQARAFLRQHEYGIVKDAKHLHRCPVGKEYGCSRPHILFSDNDGNIIELKLFSIAGAISDYEEFSVKESAKLGEWAFDPLSIYIFSGKRTFLNERVLDRHCSLQEDFRPVQPAAVDATADGKLQIGQLAKTGLATLDKHKVGLALGFGCGIGVALCKFNKN